MKFALGMFFICISIGCGSNNKSSLSYDNILENKQSSEILLHAILDWERDFGDLSDRCKRDLNNVQVFEYDTDFKVVAECNSSKPIVGCMLQNRLNSKEYKLVVNNNNNRTKRYAIYQLFARWASTCEHGSFIKDEHRNWVKRRYLR